MHYAYSTAKFYFCFLLHVPRAHGFKIPNFFAMYVFFSPFDIKKENVSNKNCTFYANFWSHQSKPFTFVYSKLVRPSYFVFVFLSSVHKQKKDPRFLYSLLLFSSSFFCNNLTNSTQLLVFKEKSQISALIHIYKWMNSQKISKRCELFTSSEMHRMSLGNACYELSQLQFRT